MAIIEGSSISHIYSGNTKPTLNNLSFSMEYGEFVAIPSGIFPQEHLNCREPETTQAANNGKGHAEWA